MNMTRITPFRKPALRPTSQRMLLALGVFAFGLSACGDPATTTPAGASVTTASARRAPQVIHIAGAAGGASRSATADVAPEAIDGSSKIRPGSVTYVWSGSATGLDGTAPSWSFPAGVIPTDDQLRGLAQAFGLTGDPQPVPADEGGGWRFGSADGTAAGLQISSGATLDWWYSPGPIAGVSPVTCETVAAVEPLPVESAIPAVTVDPAVDVAPDSGCSTPEPPKGVPSDAEALAKATEMFAAMGLDPASYKIDATGDEWGRSVVATLQLDGHAAPITTNIGFGAEGAVTWASGMLAQPVRAGDYPRIGITAGVQRLNDQAVSWGPLTRGGVVTDVAAGASGVAPVAVDAPASPPIADVCVDPGPVAIDVAPPGSSEGLVAPGVATAAADSGASTGSGGAAGSGVASAPAGTVIASDVAVAPPGGCNTELPPAEPITINLTGVTEDLTMIWATDGTVWLMPAYTFTASDAGQYQVPAIDDSFLQTDAPTADPAVSDPSVVAPVPGVVGGGGDGTSTSSADPSITRAPGGAGPSVEDAAVLVGLTEDEATAQAKTHGWIIRVARRDGQDLALTADFSLNRVNVAVDAGAVTSILSIG